MCDYEKEMSELIARWREKASAMRASGPGYRLASDYIQEHAIQLERLSERMASAQPRGPKFITVVFVSGNTVAALEESALNEARARTGFSGTVKIHETYQVGTVPPLVADVGGHSADLARASRKGDRIYADICVAGFDGDLRRATGRTA